MEELEDASLAEPVDEMVQEDALQKVRDSLDRLDPDDRKIIEMLYFQDKTHREIALEMNFAKSTATRRIAAILARLKESLMD
jgi:RNA polymerase sigma factor (sigma-70 family)